MPHGWFVFDAQTDLIQLPRQVICYLDRLHTFFIIIYNYYFQPQLFELLIDTRDEILHYFL